MTRPVGSGVKSRVGDDLVEAFNEMARHLRGEITIEYYEVEDSEIGPSSVDKPTVRRLNRKKA